MTTTSIPTTAEVAARRDFGRVFLNGRCKNWMIRYRVDGREYQESSGSANRRSAEKLLDKRAAQYDIGDLTAPAVKRVRFDQLAER